MDVKQAVKIAKDYVLELFSDEELVNVGLEEVELVQPDDEWVVTIGFSRPWDAPSNTLAAIASGGPRRAFKVVTISNSSHNVLSVKDRILKN
ncbi:hypothetical protein [Chitinilyticum aquatile]|uniref:hypothetical protein n=1 Tax=Chitinilyticum aquatile TaxID=362520 RepID=UPI0009D659BC|nr:hypothetical protein [Chitinilyticum aquatile]